MPDTTISQPNMHVAPKAAIQQGFMSPVSNAVAAAIDVTTLAQEQVQRVRLHAGFQADRERIAADRPNLDGLKGNEAAAVTQKFESETTRFTQRLKGDEDVSSSTTKVGGTERAVEMRAAEKLARSPADFVREAQKAEAANESQPGQPAVVAEGPSPKSPPPQATSTSQVATDNAPAMAVSAPLGLIPPLAEHKAVPMPGDVRPSAVPQASSASFNVAAPLARAESYGPTGLALVGIKPSELAMSAPASIQPELASAAPALGSFKRGGPMVAASVETLPQPENTHLKPKPTVEVADVAPQSPTMRFARAVGAESTQGFRAATAELTQAPVNPRGFEIPQISVSGPVSKAIPDASFADVKPAVGRQPLRLSDMRVVPFMMDDRAQPEAMSVKTSGAAPAAASACSSGPSMGGMGK